MRRSWIPVACAFIFAACHKTTVAPPAPRTFTGVVLDGTTHQPIQGALVKIVRYPLTLNTQGIDPGFIQRLGTDLFSNLRADTAITNASGAYSITLDPSRPPYASYSPLAYKDGYVYGFGTPVQRSVVRDTLSDTIYLDANSYFRLTINHSAASPTDTFGVTTRFVHDTSETAYLYQGMDSLSYFGSASNIVLTDTVSYRLYPKVHVRWTLRNGTLLNQGDQVIDLTPFGTKDARIDY